MKMTLFGKVLVHDTDLVRLICSELAAETDPHKTDELYCLLRAVLTDDQEEVEVRMTFLAWRYPYLCLASESKAAA